MRKVIKYKAAAAALIAVLMLSACSKAGTADTSGGHSDNQIQNRNMDTGEDVSAAETDKYSGGSVVLSEASTRILDKSENRVNNINLACERLKELVIESGMEFSFNRVVGERNAENGYKEASAFLYKKRVSEVGGGVCQVSTTVYQAALNAGLEITERNPHQKKVNYAGKNLDACVEYGKLDLKFRNNTDKSIILKVSTNGEYVFATIQREEA